MSGYTKSPWRCKAKDGSQRLFQFKRRFWQIGGGPMSNGVAFVFGGDEANACLIAAAPELLEALKGIEERIKQCWHDTPEYVQYAAVIASKAIAKAEGR